MPTLVKDNVDVAGMPTQAGHRRLGRPPRQADGDFARMYLATGLIPLGKTQLSEYGFSAAAEHPRLGRRALALGHRPHRRRVARPGSAALVAAGARADRPRQRRWRLDPDPGLGQRAGRASSRPATGWRRTR